MEVIVPDDQLSLAIGKRGQNVRLAHRLTGWKLDVRSEAEAEEEARTARASLNAIPGIGDINAELLFQWGYRSAEQLAEADPDGFEVEGISLERARQLITAARAHVAEKKKREEEAKAAAEAKALAEAEAAAEAATAAATEKAPPPEEGAAPAEGEAGAAVAAAQSDAEAKS